MLNKWMKNKRYLEMTWHSLREKDSLIVPSKLEINYLFSGKKG